VTFFPRVGTGEGVVAHRGRRRDGMENDRREVSVELERRKLRHPTIEIKLLIYDPSDL
jgi:hypothetical protein